MNEAQQFTLVLAANPDGSVQAMALDDKDTEVASGEGKSIAYAVMNLGVALEHLLGHPEPVEPEPDAPDWDSLEQGGPC